MKHLFSKLYCSNPKVQAIWETGSLGRSDDSKMVYNIHIVYNVNERKDFSGENIDMVKKEADDFIDKIKP